jgi:16S rRNA (adenine1518-N6/adenine1519-N6)-dimethyltransferase
VDPSAGLLGAGASVTAIELDRGLAARLRRELTGAIEVGLREPSAPGALTLVEGDVLDVDLGAIVAPPFDVVANLPYHITSPVLHRLLGGPPRPDRLVLMVQREVAERIAAAPGAMSYLSVFVRYHASAHIALQVPPTAFEPAPAVGSAVVVLDATEGIGGLDAADEDELWRLVQAGFRERRKMIHNVLARQLPVDGSRVDAALREAGIAPDRRPQTLSVEEWLRLRAALTPIGPDMRGRARRADAP